MHNQQSERYDRLEFFVNGSKFKWNQHIEIKNQQTKYDNFQFLHTIAFFMKPMHEYIWLTC